jgi:hypothetical protein
MGHLLLSSRAHFASADGVPARRGRCASGVGSVHLGLHDGGDMHEIRAFRVSGAIRAEYRAKRRAGLDAGLSDIALADLATRRQCRMASGSSSHRPVGRGGCCRSRTRDQERRKRRLRRPLPASERQSRRLLADRLPARGASGRVAPIGSLGCTKSERRRADRQRGRCCPEAVAPRRRRGARAGVVLAIHAERVRDARPPGARSRAGHAGASDPER